MSADITVAELHIPESGGTRLPLTALSVDEHHLHGLLRIEISGRALPQLGFFGPNDVCLDTWLEELAAIEAALGDTRSGEYTFDELEQGQPAFIFRREGAHLLVSVVDSPIGGGRGDPSFVDVRCEWADFAAAIERFHSALRAKLVADAPSAGQAWLETHMPAASPNRR